MISSHSLSDMQTKGPHGDLVFSSACSAPASLTAVIGWLAVHIQYDPDAPIALPWRSICGRVHRGRLAPSAVTYLLHILPSPTAGFSACQGAWHLSGGKPPRSSAWRISSGVSAQAARGLLILVSLKFWASNSVGRALRARRESARAPSLKQKPAAGLITY